MEEKDLIPKHTNNKKKELQISTQEIGKMHSNNKNNLSLLETDHAVYDNNQDERNKVLYETEIKTDQELILIRQNIITIKNQLRVITKNFSLLVKNFKNYVKKDELEYVKGKVDSFKFEQLATEHDLEKIKNSQ
jgi:hypothetical protein